MNDNDHDKIIRIETKLDGLLAQFTNHLKHHWAIDCVLLTVIVGLVAKLLYG